MRFVNLTISRFERSGEVLFIDVQPLPACYWVCTDNGVNGTEFIPDIIWSTSLVRPNRTAMTSCNGLESLCRVYSRQSLQKLLIRRAQSVVGLICRCPECIASGLWQSMDFQNRVIGGSFLKRDTTIRTLRT